MAFNSSGFIITATTTAQTLNLPSLTASLILRALSTNTDYINVQLGGGSPIRLNAGDNFTISIENILLALRMQGITIPPQILITSATITSNSGSQTLLIDGMEWREA